MSDTIRDICDEQMRQAGLTGYRSQAEPIVSALEAREQDLASQLLDFAVENGLTRDQATQVLSGMGMMVPAGGAGDDKIVALEAQIAEMQQTLRDLRG